MFHTRNIVGVSAAALTLAAPALVRARTLDSGFQTYDRRTIDSTGAFLIGELERLDQEDHAPLYATTWGRDIDLREDVSMGDEVSSFTNSTFASVGGTTPGGKSWASKAANQIAGIALDIGKTANPLPIWAQELKYSLPELESAIRAGRPIDAQKYTGLSIKHDMDIDEQVYIGDAELGMFGLANSPLVAASNVANGAAASPLWRNKTADEIVADINDVLTASWTATGYSVVPSKLLLAPLKFSYLVSRKVSEAGNISVLEYVKQNCIANAQNGRPLDIQPVKWLTGRGVGGTDRMLAYTQQKNRVRFPMVPLQRTPLEYRSLYQITTYYGRLGAVEFVYPETVAYADGM
ncbi:DUF2184 domain-containing protein [Methylobacterium sp. CCH5-D2]|uniref:DUF2184 domain-containing protein n=1 Tax=Methylobacterium sp. CCH5-D2 TaxID=1768765 RepID=UPI000833E280|nr:DUF2184 domain-containing protein [Methylobacterium sp. CCH5-D2]